MRFQCLDVTCGKPFGWTAKKIVTVDDKTVIEYVCCPYCGSLDFEESNGTIKKKLKETTPPVQMPTPVAIRDDKPIQTTYHSGEFNPEELMNHKWKGKKIPNTHPTQYEEASLKYGWDFKDQFSTPVLDALLRGKVNVDKYVFELKGNIVTTKKAD